MGRAVGSRRARAGSGPVPVAGSTEAQGRHVMVLVGRLEDIASNCHAADMPSTPRLPPEPEPSGALPSTMRAAVTTQARWSRGDRAPRRPVPQARTHEVLVRVSAAGCNNTDLWTREGAYGRPRARRRPVARAARLPPDPGRRRGRRRRGGGGAEAGRRGVAGAGGPRHYEDPGPTRADDVLGSERDGGFAEYVVVPSDRAHRVDESPLDDVELAALPIAYGTALGMLERGSVADGHTVLVTGASGGVGLAAVQLARARGARVVAVCSGDKGDAVREAGADAIVDRRRGQVLADAAAAAPSGYDAVVDVVAGPLLGPGLGLLRTGGRWLVAGALDGWAVDLDVRRLYLANLSLVGSTMHTPRISISSSTSRAGVPCARSSPRPSTSTRWPRRRRGLPSASTSASSSSFPDDELDPGGPRGHSRSTAGPHPAHGPLQQARVVGPPTGAHPSSLRSPSMLNRTKKILAGGVLLLAGFGGGAALAVSGSASAAGDATATPDESSHRGHAGETPLTGSTADKVKAAALAKYPGATIDRLETDSDGVYEAHVTTKAGDEVIVQVGKAFAVTGTQTGGRHGDGHRGDHGGDHDGDDGDDDGPAAG